MNTGESSVDLTPLIRDVPDFPSPGIIFKDISPLLADPGALDIAVKQMTSAFDPAAVDVVAGIEARGFIFGPLVARELGVGFVPIRKPGKLPSETTSVAYDLEYGSDTLEMHTDACPASAEVLLVDDVLATGGTLLAARRLIESVGATVSGISVLMELVFLGGRAKLENIHTHAVIEVD